MMNILEIVRSQFLVPRSDARSKGLDAGSLEDRVLLSATPLDTSALDLEDPSANDVELADGTEAVEVSEVGLAHDGFEMAPDLLEGLNESDLDGHLDAFGNEYHALTDLPTLDADPVGSNDPLIAAASPFALSETFLLNSNLGASHTIYLDFDGHLTTGTYWNSSFNNGNDIYTAAYDFDGDTSSFSDAELERIQYIWQRVAEDFAPFDVNVTTDDPGLDGLIKSGSGDTDWGTRVVIGGSSYDWYGNGAGGVAYVGSFNWNTDTPAFVFEEQLGNGNEKYVAEATSHEIGHTLGLGHDGSSSSSYYSGHGSGDTGWAPIMGSGYYKNLTQWSSGEYSGANNSQDDLAIITSNNGFGYRVDDHGDVDSQATLLAFAGDTVSGSGIIEQNTDVDVFQFSTDGGSISLQIDPFERGPNLDLLVELYDSASNLILASNPVDYVNATIDVAVNAGQYFLYVTGTGTGDPSASGYSDYGSLGQYSISGTVTASSADSVSIAPATAVQAEGDAGGTALTFTVTRTGDLSDATSVDYLVAGSGADAAQANDFVLGALPSGTVNFAANESSKTITINVAGDLDVEADEDFTVTLSNAAGDTQIAASQATGTILNDDSVDTSDSVAVTATDASKAEGDSGSTPFTFTVTRTGYTADATTVDYSVSGSGVDADDFVGGLPSGSISFAAGETTKTITVDVAGDATIESDESFTLSLSNASGDTQITGNPADGTILNDDVATPAYGITVTPITGLVTQEQGTTATFSVVLDYQPTADVTILVSSLDTSEGTVDVGLLTFTAANWNVAQEVMVTGVNDTVRDGHVSYMVQLGAAQSTDAGYNGMDADDVEVTNQDDEKGKKTGGGGGPGGGNGGGGNGKGKKADLPLGAELSADADLDVGVDDDDDDDSDNGAHGPPDTVRDYVADRAELLRESGPGTLGAALRRLHAEDRGNRPSDDDQTDDELDSASLIQ